MPMRRVNDTETIRGVVKLEDAVGRCLGAADALMRQALEIAAKVSDSAAERSELDAYLRKARGVREEAQRLDQKSRAALAVASVDRQKVTDYR